MPVKIVGTKPDSEVQDKLTRKHPLLVGSSQEINTYIDGLQDLDDVKRVLKVLAKAIRTRGRI